MEVEATIESVKKAMAPEVGKVYKNRFDNCAYLVMAIEKCNVVTYRILDGGTYGWNISLFDDGYFVPVDGKLTFKEGGNELS